MSLNDVSFVLVHGAWAWRWGWAKTTSYLPARLGQERFPGASGRVQPVTCIA